MATAKEEKDEQEFFAGKIKEQEKEAMKHEKEIDKPEKTIDSLGQENPAQDLERVNIKEAEVRQKEADKDAKEGKKPEGH